MLACLHLTTTNQHHSVQSALWRWHGVFKAGHNDQSFNLENAEHVDADRSKWNVYWDYLQGYDITLQMKMESDRKDKIYLIILLIGQSGLKIIFRYIPMIAMH